MSKICVIYLGKTGAGNIFTYQMVNALLKKKCSVSLIISKYVENLDKFNELALNNSSLVLRTVKTYRNTKEFLINSLNIFRFFSLSSYLKKIDCDWVYIPMISLWASILSYFLPRSIKIVTTIHDVNMHLGEENKFIDKINTHLIKKSSKIITLTNSFKTKIAQKYNKSLEDISWIEHANFNYYRPDFFINKQLISNKILFFGRIHKYKGISILLDAMLLLKNKGSLLTLDIVGNGKFSSDDMEKIKHLGNSVNIINRWIKDDEIYSYFENIDLVVVPYIEASQSGVVMTAYTFGKPVIVTNVGGVPDQVSEETGVIIPPNDAHALENALTDIYSNPMKIIEMGNIAYKKVLNEFSWDVSAEKLLTFIKL